MRARRTSPRSNARLSFGAWTMWRALRYVQKHRWACSFVFAGASLAGGYLITRWLDQERKPVGESTLVSTNEAAQEAADPLPEGCVRADFNVLAGFSFQAPQFNPDQKPGSFEAEANRQIPESVRALDGKRVRVRGFLISSDFTKGLTRECLVLRSQMFCCYGRRPADNEWVVVKLPPPGLAIQQDEPMDVIGTLHVGAVTHGGFLSQLYTLDGESIHPAPVVPLKTFLQSFTNQ